MRSSLDYDQLPVHFVHAGGGGRRMYFIQFLAVQRGVMSSKVSIDECHTYCIARGMSMDDVSELE